MVPTHANKLRVFCSVGQTTEKHVLLKTNRKSCRRHLFTPLEATEETLFVTCVIKTQCHSVPESTDICYTIREPLGLIK